MLSTLHERLAIDVPSVDLPLHAASLALARPISGRVAG
jgi:hypothetical protein